MDKSEIIRGYIDNHPKKNDSELGRLMYKENTDLWKSSNSARTAIQYHRFHSGQRDAERLRRKLLSIQLKKNETHDYLQKRILIFDIETAPNRASVWGMWKQNIAQNQVLQYGYVLCYAAKWLGEDRVLMDALPFYKEYNKDMENDYMVCKSLWELLDKADIVIAHNGGSFDVPIMNTRFCFHGMKPPSPYKVIDTLKIAKAQFRFPSNRLDSIGAYLGVGRKVENSGMDLWNGCRDGDLDSWAQMGEYNIGDVELLEQIYLKLRPFDKMHPNVGIYDRTATKRCTVCGSEDLVVGENVYTNLSSFTSYQCSCCGHWNRERINHFGIAKRQKLLSNVM